MRSRYIDRGVPSLDKTDAHDKKLKGRPGLVRQWLAGTLALLLVTGLTLRPDRDVTQYLKHQHILSAQSDVGVRQLLTHTRVLQAQRLTIEEIERELLDGGSLTYKVRSKVVELQAALGAREQAKERLILFATIALLPPLTALELGVALFWARRGLRAWTDAPISSRP